MVIEQKALVGKLKKFPSGIQRLYSLSVKFHSAEMSDLFKPFQGKGPENQRQTLEADDKNGKELNTLGLIKTRVLSQTYPQWKVMCDVQKLHSFQKRKRFKNRTMYILPLCTSDEKEIINRLANEHYEDHGANVLDIVIKFIALFFDGLHIKLLPFQDIESLGFTTRVHGKTNRKQILVTDILSYLNKIRCSDAFCLVGWTSLDLYPSPELNFVLGEACFDSGCAVVSFGRYADIGDTSSGIVNKNDLQNLHRTFCTTASLAAKVDEFPAWNCTNLGDNIVWRVLKVLTHEVCHLVGMHHCTFFACLMNESSNVSEAENQPMFLCPVCLRKLQKFLHFPVVARYKALKNFLEQKCSILAAQPRELSTSVPGSGQVSSYSADSEEVVARDSRDNLTSTYYTLYKFKNCVTWLNDVLKFIS